MIGNRVKETTTTTGTGNLTLAGAATNYQTFNSVFGTSKQFYYSIIDSTNNVWEIGQGHLSASTTLVRDKILENSSGGSTALSLSAGTKDVIVSANAHNMFGAMQGVNNLSTRGVCSLHVRGHSNATLGTGTNDLNYMPYLSPITMLTTGVSFNITATTVSASDTFRWGLYDIGDDGLPQNLIAETADIDCSTTGIKSPTWSSSTMIYAGHWYFAAFGSDTPVTVTSWNAGSTTSNPFGMDTTNIRIYQSATEGLAGGWTSLPTSPSPSSYLAANNKMLAVNLTGQLV